MSRDLTAGAAIEVRGARTHNLKNVRVSIPLNELTVITGVSGSGKSSLAFDTLYAEGQRRYVESLSAYARQFLERMDKPDVEEIVGICPAISIRQRNSSRNPRSTVATQTEIYDYLRLLYARIGQTYCYQCGHLIQRDNPETIANQILNLPDGTRFYLLFPIEHSAAPNLETSKETTKKTKTSWSVAAQLMSLMQRGFSRLYYQEQIIELNSPDDFKAASLRDAYVLVDRLSVQADIRQRLVDSLEVCYQEGHGRAEIHILNAQRQVTDKFIFSERYACKYCQIIYPDPEPRLFSFNNPYGACPTCQGFGNTVGIDLDLVIPNQDLSLQAGAIDIWKKPQYQDFYDELEKVCRRQRISLVKPFRELSAAQQDLIINGLEGRDGFKGLRGFFEWLETKKYKLHIRVLLSKYRGYTTCYDCQGGRLRREARAIKIGGLNLSEIVALSIKQAHDFFAELTLATTEQTIAERLLVEIKRRLRFLVEVGLEYLTLNRLASTLSGGEAQRIQLATNLGSSLVGALYILDEPSIGLHPRDNARLINILQRLRDIGNTVVVVEHEPAMILAADNVIDVGPGAGELGGEIMFQGSLSQLLQQKKSLTAKYLRHELEIKPNAQRRTPGSKKLVVWGASEHNLKQINLEIPLGLMTCITGVSGSGKSTLVHKVLYAGLKKQRGEWQEQEKVGAYHRIEGGNYLSDIVLVDQSPIGRTPRSNPITYIKAYDTIRELFAEQKEAKLRGYNAGHFSFNVEGGRCETCQGDGSVTVEMQFLADVELVCEECKGTRFKDSLLDVRYRGLNIHEVLQLTVREAISFFADVPRLTRKLKALEEVGLGYLRLGQSATTLSGGEAQRLKLAVFLAKSNTEQTLFIFDEPTTGLHFDDINKLLQAFQRLLDIGNSLIIIEHNLDVIKLADWVVDLGPEGGQYGGYVVAVGSPEDIAANAHSHTGQFLREALQQMKLHCSI
jgi:excinuclease ABC subunit A